MPTWTDERVTTLRELWAEGLSASQIAHRLKTVSRSAVIGKIHRLGLSGRSASRRECRPKAVINRTINAKLRRATTTHKPKGPTQPPKFPTYAVVDPIIEDVPPAARVNLHDLMPDSCRWPIGTPGHPEFGFCPNSHAEGLPYCEGHARVAYASPRVSVRVEPVAAKALVEA